MRRTIAGVDTSLPDFLIIGAGRSGTSSLYYYLSEHREIFLPHNKEPHFFNFPEKLGLAEYLEMFSPAREWQRIGEATASYLYYYETTIANIKKYYGSDYKKVKIIAILRNPIERAWSYFHLLKRRNITFEFFDAIERFCKDGETKHYHNFILSGKYYRPLKAFTEEFPHVKVILFEHFRTQTDWMLKEVYDFLELNDRNFIPSNLNLTYNAAGLPKNKFLTPLFNFLFRDNALKDKLKRVIPINQRQKIKSLIANSIIEKKAIPKNVDAYLKDYYKADMAALTEMFDHPEHKAIIQNWVRSERKH